MERFFSNVSDKTHAMESRVSRPLVNVRDTAGMNQNIPADDLIFDSHSSSENVTITIKISSARDGIVMETETTKHESCDAKINKQCDAITHDTCETRINSPCGNITYEQCGLRTHDTPDTSSPDPRDIRTRELFDTRRNYPSDTTTYEPNDTQTQESCYTGTNDEFDNLTHEQCDTKRSCEAIKPEPHDKTVTQKQSKIVNRDSNMSNVGNSNTYINEHEINPKSIKMQNTTVQKQPISCLANDGELDNTDSKTVGILHKDATVTENECQANDINKQSNMHETYNSLQDMTDSTYVTNQGVRPKMSINTEIKINKKPKVIIVKDYEQVQSPRNENDDHNVVSPKFKVPIIADASSSSTNEGENFMDYLKHLKGADTDDAEKLIAAEEYSNHTL